MTRPVDPIDGDELARRLEAYAELRLSPDPASAGRSRSAILAEARRPKPGPALAGPERTARRRWLAVSLAAALTVVFGVGAVASAAPGGALYQFRLWAEGVILPASGDARSDAILAHLVYRIDEASAAAARGDDAAVAEALAAYRSEVEAALTAAGDDDERLARLEAALGKHLAVLEALTEKVPEQARGAIEHAIEQSAKAVEQIGESGGPDASHGPERTPRPGNGPGDPASDGPGASDEDEQ